MATVPSKYVPELADCFKSLSKTVYVYAYKRVNGDTGWAEDLVQQAFVEAAVHWELLRTRSQEDRTAWLCLVVKQDAIDRIRRLSTTQHKQDALWHATRPSQLDPFDAANMLLLIDRCNDAIEQMPLRRREVARLKWRAGRSNAEIAQTLGITEKAVSSHVASARRELRAVIKAQTVLTELPGKEGHPDDR